MPYVDLVNEVLEHAVFPLEFRILENLESFEKELNRARRYGLPLSTVILDLHRFKEVNDKYGHPRGDEVLRAVAQTLHKTMRTSDSAFRIGGDEFALLLPQTDAAQALALSRRIGSVFAETLQSIHLAIHVDIDHGVATFPQDGDQSDQLIRAADERLYRSKHAGHPRTTGIEESQAGVDFTPRSVPPVTISIESGRPSEKSSSDSPITSSSAPHPLTGQTVSPSAPESYAVQRKAERVSMTGTNAYAVIGEQGDRRARVLDLGFGGVALELEHPEEFAANFLAILHVPILPPVRVFLRPVWTRRISEGAFRIGCHFIS